MLSEGNDQDNATAELVAATGVFTEVSDRVRGVIGLDPLAVVMAEHFEGLGMVMADAGELDLFEEFLVAYVAVDTAREAVFPGPEGAAFIATMLEPVADLLSNPNRLN